MSIPGHEYLHTPEDCGTHDIDIEGECLGCGMDALDVVDEWIKDAEERGRTNERRAIIAMLRRDAADRIDLWDGGNGERALYRAADDIERGKHRTP